MPRSIIDTESSRPRAVRRRFLLVVLVVLLVLLAVYTAELHARHPSQAVPVPGKSALRYESGAS